MADGITRVFNNRTISTYGRKMSNNSSRLLPSKWMLIKKSKYSNHCLYWKSLSKKHSLDSIIISLLFFSFQAFFTYFGGWRYLEQFLKLSPIFFHIFDSEPSSKIILCLGVYFFYTAQVPLLNDELSLHFFNNFLHW